MTENVSHIECLWQGAKHLENIARSRFSTILILRPLKIECEYFWEVAFDQTFVLIR